jgi:hypothetical protein
MKSILKFIVILIVIESASYLGDSFVKMRWSTFYFSEWEHYERGGFLIYQCLAIFITYLIYSPFRDR